MKLSEREQLIGWLIENLPGGPDYFRQHAPHIISHLTNYDIHSLRELKAYAEHQLTIYKNEKAQFEALLERIKPTRINGVIIRKFVGPRPPFFPR